MTKNARLLLVDDDRVFSKGLANSSKKNKFFYDTANTFEDAVCMIKATRYDAYILDIDLNSSKDGFFLGDFIRTRAPKAPIIIISGIKGNDPIVKTLEHRFDHFFTKSMD